VEAIPTYLAKPGVVGVGEIGLEPKSPNADLDLQMVILKRQLELAREHNAPVWLHTPHGNKVSWVETYLKLIDEMKMDRDKVAIGHCNGDVIKTIQDAGLWADLTVQPWRGVTPSDASTWLQEANLDRIFLSSDSNTTNMSDPLGVPKTALAMRMQGFSQGDIKKVTYDSAYRFFNLRQ
jgi:hypothetical protein